jgi:integrase/recombinase XerD
VSAFAERADEYRRLHRTLGHDLADAVRLLPRFVAYLDSIGATTITVEATIAWATTGTRQPTGRWRHICLLRARSRSQLIFGVSA